LLISSINQENQTTILDVNPKSVWGYVYDRFGSPVIGAHVNVSIWSGTTYRSGHDTDSIDDGFYSWDFSAGEWDKGNTIKVIATLDPDQGTNQTLADESSDQQLDVSFSTIVPEFGTVPLAFPTFGVIILIVVLSSGAKRR